MPSEQDYEAWLIAFAKPFGHRTFHPPEEIEHGWEFQCTDCEACVEVGYDPYRHQYFVMGDQNLAQCDYNEDYSGLTDEEFDKILTEIVGEMSPAAILATPGVYEILAEELNNEVLARWEAHVLPDDEHCREQDQGLICTLQKGHKSREHQAGTGQGRVVHRWPREEVPGE